MHRGGGNHNPRCKDFHHVASIAYPIDCPVSDYVGLPSIFEFTNWDGTHTRFNCGQAAACTLLTHHGKLESTSDVMLAVESAHPPDNLGGYLGTSRRRLERVCRVHGVLLGEVEGEDELRARLAERRPVIVMLQINGPRIFGYPVPLGHWMVAYGFDHDYIYLTNWGRMIWADFRRGWAGRVPWLIRMKNRGLVARS